MGRASRDKGARTEREAVRILQEHGLSAERVPLSGASGGRYAGDVSVPVLGVDRTLECKCRADGFKQIYAWLADNYGLILRADRAQPLIAIRLRDFAELAIAAGRWQALNATDFPDDLALDLNCCGGLTKRQCARLRDTEFCSGHATASRKVRAA